MTVELIDPPGLPVPGIYRQMAVTRGSRTVYLAGQVARTAEGQPVGAGDLAAQAEQAFLNVATALEAAGGSFDDVAKLVLYVVDWDAGKLPALGEGVARASARLGRDLTRPVTLIPVVALGEPDLLIEVDATAVLD
ncbi:Enamine deaminase RidA, house cleaning of reactive enamine intermediates, YjgF/YER057c/UK114 family [Geodermatophilus saharensis]|uniref:Enamine deaminase RidA, house cleaning of reactive enamine intermediates, YjgF/YER057c/UK114 family n=1 Tax=Geodermatophilus saharensis TaxID=1137994 RepID=A0A239CMK2_9ACTN|nr:RidA family protein [Geodermatophilus saharensis]SNS21395.1 Enamine deaminase RidA, house cleaning of reactive enamine intermediates, YjgF/YER057c/UK114 family [Geodermatophilus saharensis]